ncbi:MAG: hypothetical protein HY960_01750 [Ignavibacteriae bacterium]|nr:hypothetical protein [Ignavibacteriota bacterium]
MNSNHAKILLFVITATIVIAVSYSYIFPSATLGDFSKFQPNSEINQIVNVEIVSSQPMERDANGNVFSFIAKDINNTERKVELHEPVSKEIINAGVVELLGHFHGDVFTATRVTPVKE